MSIKGLSYRVTEWPPPLHAPMQFVLFGVRTVPALELDGEKVSGSRAIMRRLEQLAPEPSLFPADPAARARVEEAERWGDEVFQPVARSRHCLVSSTGSTAGSRTERSGTPSAPTPPTSRSPRRCDC